MSGVESNPVVVVGGGLVGSLLASFLVERGHDVVAYERRPDLRAAAGAEGGRSINLVLTRRGIRALERVGLAAGALDLTVPVLGRMMHPVAGGLVFQPYGKDDSECNHSIPRGGLNAFLIEAAERRGARFRFRTRLEDADLASGRLHFVDDASGAPLAVEAGVVFGTDGAGSAVRRAFATLDGFTESVDFIDYGYKELTIPPAADGGFRIEERALHIWPRGSFMLMALPNRDGSFTVTLYLAHEGEDSFASLDTPERVLALFRREFPDAVPLIPDLTEAFFTNPTGPLGTVRCAPWHCGDRALLLGDAAHAIVPFFGQGMNTGFEDCTVLGELLDAAGDPDWGHVFAEMTRRRKPNADAIADMALENFVEMRDKVGDAEFLLRKQVEHRLEQVAPRAYRSRYSMVMYSHIPFRLAQQAGRIQQGILDELCAGVDSADAVDLDRALALVRARLTPWLAEHGIALDY